MENETFLANFSLFHKPHNGGVLFQIYLPCYLIVVLAWVSFWVDREQTAARIAMGITTVLTMATLIGSARTSLPKVSYVKSLEWFLMMCFLFVFSAILEYAFVSYLVFKNRVEEREREAMRKKHDEVGKKKKQFPVILSCLDNLLRKYNHEKCK